MSRIYLSYDTSDPETWTVERSYQRDTSLGTVVVPQGFATDLASTPHTVWHRFPRWGRWSGAALIHDFFYRTKPAGLTRYRADRIMFELMKQDGVRYGDAAIIFRAVREFGESAWRQKGA